MKMLFFTFKIFSNWICIKLKQQKTPMCTKHYNNTNMNAEIIGKYVVQTMKISKYSKSKTEVKYFNLKQR